MKLNTCVCGMKMFFNLNSQGIEKFELFSQGTYDCQNLGNETMFVADYENVKKPTFDWLATKLWLKGSSILWNVCTFE